MGIQGKNNLWIGLLWLSGMSKAIRDSHLYAKARKYFVIMQFMHKMFVQLYHAVLSPTVLSTWNTMFSTQTLQFRIQNCTLVNILIGNKCFRMSSSTSKQFVRHRANTVFNICPSDFLLLQSNCICHSPSYIKAVIFIDAPFQRNTFYSVWYGAGDKGKLPYNFDLF